MKRLLVLLTLASSLLIAEDPVEFICPMDPDVRSLSPGSCPRCGMKLMAGIPDPVEYPVNVKVTPRAFKPGEKVRLTFEIRDPKTAKLVTDFQIVHERLFHLFLVSEDLSFFVHDHPTLDPDHRFHFDAVFPKPGPYRVLCDFYPSGGTPQLITRTVIAPGEPPGGEFQTPNLPADKMAKKAENLEVEFFTYPANPIAGSLTLLFFKVKPEAGLEQYLGAWGHMLIASDDSIDLIHAHPFIADGGPQIQFNMIFPRARTYRIWAQFQRNGVVNTVAFNVPVTELK